MTRKTYYVAGEGFGEVLFLRVVRPGVKFGLARTLADATAFRSASEAGAYASRAGACIMRLFKPIEVEDRP